MSGNKERKKLIDKNNEAEILCSKCGKIILIGLTSYDKILRNVVYVCKDCGNYSIAFLEKRYDGWIARGPI